MKNFIKRILYAFVGKPLPTDVATPQLGPVPRNPR
jgi:hypothetical protein